ncbi:MAG: ThiF family adenylyltransferase, partial [Spirochaetota bacterium]
MSNADRFTRHRALLGEPGLERLSKATVAVCGAGGLGSTLLTLIAR